MSAKSLFLTVHYMHYTWFHQKETDVYSSMCHLNKRMDFYIYNSYGGPKVQYEYLVTNFSVHLSQEMAVQVLDRCM
jgi:hypothetical protein